MLIFAGERGQTLVGAVVALVAIYQVRFQSDTSGSIPDSINFLIPMLQASKTLPTKLGVSNRSFFGKMSPGLVEKPPFRVSGLNQLRVGLATNFIPKGSNGPTMAKGKSWALPAGAYTPRQIVEATAPLLEVVLHHLGPNPPGSLTTPREMLLDNLASNLALGTRESSITIPTRDPSTAEMAAQAVRIGKVLVNYARNVSDVEYDPQYVVRSPCEGHLLKPEVSNLMFGPRSLRHLMQIYNEYLHQMVLLRDALLPFENFEDVVIPINAEPDRKRGVRHTEDTRASFLTGMMTKSVTQDSVVKFAESLLAPELSSDNVYGFQYQHGVVLPALVTGGGSRGLLRYIPAVLDRAEEQAVFQYELRDYYIADRTEIPTPEKLTSGDQSEGTSARNGTTDLQATLIPVPTGTKAARYLVFTLESGKGTTVRVDLGQIARGRRYAYVVGHQQGASIGVAPKEVKVYSAWKVLTDSGPGLVMANGGDNLIQANSNVELLALLGKLYPENVVFKEKGQSLKDALEAGKGLPEAGRFIVEMLGEEASVMPCSSAKEPYKGPIMR